MESDLREFRRENQRDEIMNRNSNEGRGSYGEAPSNDFNGVQQSQSIAGRSQRFADLLNKVENNMDRNKRNHHSSNLMASDNGSIGNNRLNFATQGAMGSGGYTSNIRNEVNSILDQERTIMPSSIPNRAVSMTPDYSAKNQKYQKRVDGILGRLNDMQVDIEKEKQGKLMNLDQQLGQTDGQLIQWQEANLKKFADFKQKVNECLRYIENDKSAQQYEHDMQLQEVAQLEKTIEERFHQEKMARKEMEQRLLQLVEEKFLGVRKTLSQESRNRYESIEQLKSSLENDMPRLQELIQTESESRGNRDGELFSKIDIEVKQCVEAIEMERKQREETEEAVLEVIKDMTTKIKQEIMEEHREREENFETLLNLLEDKSLQNF